MCPGAGPRPPQESAGGRAGAVAGLGAVRDLRAADDGALSHPSGRPVPRLCVPGRWHRARRGPCQGIPGSGIDEAIGELLLEMLTPATLEVALAVQQELRQRLDEADGLRRQQVERARYEADLARQRYMSVDPNNRFVADALEADWNDKLRALTEAQERFERQSQADRAVLDERGRAQILALSTDFSRVWRDPKTPDRDRKRIVRLLVEDVALVKAERITAQVRFKGGSARTLILSIPPPAWVMRQTSPEVIAEIDGLLNHHTEAQIAGLLNEQGRRSGKGRPFTPRLVGQIRRAPRSQEPIRPPPTGWSADPARDCRPSRGLFDHGSRLAAEWPPQGLCLQRQAGVSLRARGRDRADETPRDQTDRPAPIPQGLLRWDERGAR